MDIKNVVYEKDQEIKALLQEKLKHETEFKSEMKLEIMNDEVSKMATNVDSM